MIRIAISILTLLGAITALASPEHDEYTKIFPVHAEFCALTQIKPVKAGAGGRGGHATLYVEGLCKDYSVNYPKVIPCSKAKVPAEYAHTGVGISVDNDYRNINWSAVPGYDLFTHGITPNPGKVDIDAKNAVVIEATRLKVYNGVKFNPDLVSPKTLQPDYQAQVAAASIGTDLAVQFGRDMECVRFPLPEAKLQEMADYLNAKNFPYVRGKKVYEWSGFHNNCAMLSANALWAVGVRDEIPMDQIAIRQIANIGLPRNGLTWLQDIVHYGGLDGLGTSLDFYEFAGMNYEAVHADPVRWKSLLESNYVATGFGGISKVFKVYPDNVLYESKGLENVYIWSKKPWLYHLSRKAFKDPRFTDLGQNAQYWHGVYERVLADSKKSRQTPSRMKYQAFIERELERVEASGLLK